MNKGNALPSLILLLEKKEQLVYVPIVVFHCMENIQG